MIATFPKIFNIKLKPKAIREPKRSRSRFLFFENKISDNDKDNKIIAIAENGSRSFFQNSYEIFFLSLSGPVWENFKNLRKRHFFEP